LQYNKHIMNLEKNNSDLQESLLSNTSEVYIENEDGDDVSLTELSDNHDIETAYDISLKAWDLYDEKNGAEDNVEEDKNKTELKTAIEIAMNKTNPLKVVFLDPERGEKLRTAADIAIEKADRLIAEEEKEDDNTEQSLEDEERTESIVEDEENVEGSEKIESNSEKINVENIEENLSEKINKISEKEVDPSKNSSFALKTFKKWKKT